MASSTGLARAGERVWESPGVVAKLMARGEGEGRTRVTRASRALARSASCPCVRWHGMDVTGTSWAGCCWLLLGQGPCLSCSAEGGEGPGQGDMGWMGEEREMACGVPWPPRHGLAWSNSLRYRGYQGLALSKELTRKIMMT
jgi:hypothetical protein